MLYDEKWLASAFAIPVDPEWVEVARQAYQPVILAAKNGSKKLPAELHGRGELILFIAEKLKKRGEEHPYRKAWEIVGYAVPAEFEAKRGIGQPLGDLSPDANRKQYANLILSRLAHF